MEEEEGRGMKAAVHRLSGIHNFLPVLIKTTKMTEDCNCNGCFSSTAAHLKGARINENRRSGFGNKLLPFNQRLTQ